MATITTNSHQGRYLQLDVTEEWYDVNENYSHLKVVLSSIGGSSNYYTIYNWGASVNGEVLWATQTTGWSARTFPAAKGSETKYINVYHNADGSIGAVGFSLSGKVYASGTDTFYGSIGLTQGYRDIAVYQSVGSKTATSITMNWSTDNTANYIWYSIDDGNTWIAVGDVNATSGSYTITGLNPNTSYNIKTKARRSGTNRENASGRSAISTYQNYSSVSSVTAGDISPFSFVAYCVSSNPSNTDAYEYTLCDAGYNVISSTTTNVTYCSFAGLSEESEYYVRCRVKSTDSQVWSGYTYSSLIETPADQSKGYIKANGTWTLGKVYRKNNDEWVKAKKTYINNGDWIITINP